MSKKLMLACLLMLGGVFGLQAKQYGIEIKVEGGDAPSRTLFNLDEQPQVSYNENHELLLTLAGEVEFTLPATTGMQVRFVETGDGPSDIVQIEEQVPTYTFSDGQLSLSGLQPGSLVRVLNVQGQLLSTQRIGDDGQAALSLPMGISIVTVNDWSMKVNKQ